MRIRSETISVVSEDDGKSGKLRGFGSHALRAAVREVGTDAGEVVTAG